MQEEVTQKTIALSVKTARVTADVLKNMLRKYLSGQQQKGRNSECLQWALYCMFCLSSQAGLWCGWKQSKLD